MKNKEIINIVIFILCILLGGFIGFIIGTKVSEPLVVLQQGDIVETPFYEGKSTVLVDIPTTITGYYNDKFPYLDNIAQGHTFVADFINPDVKFEAEDHGVNRVIQWTKGSKIIGHW